MIQEALRVAKLQKARSYDKLKAVVTRPLSSHDFINITMLSTRSRGTTPQNLILDTALKSSRGTTHQQCKQVNYEK